MIKSTVNKPTFWQAIRDLEKKTGGEAVAIVRDGKFISLQLDTKDGEDFETLIKTVTEYGAGATCEKWIRWFGELLPLLVAEREAKDRLIESLAISPAATSNPAPVADALPPQAVINQWANIRQGWTVFFIRAFVENGQITDVAEVRGYIDRAGIDGHILVNSMTQGAGSFPLRLVVNSGLTMCGFSTPYANAAGGAPVMGYAVIDPDTPESVIADQLETYGARARASLRDKATAELIDGLAALAALSVPFLPESMPAPSLIRSSGELELRPPFPLEPGEITHPTSGARAYFRQEYRAALYGWQDPATVRRQRDLLAWVVLELMSCADPSRDAAALRRARDLVDQARRMGAPV